MALTDAQMADVRRFAGYALNGTTQTITINNDTVYMRFGMVTMSLYQRLTSLSAVEETVLTANYLANLTTLETAIVGASANLDTDSASVWKHNKNEVNDRSDLFNKWRRDMCSFLGLAPGPGVGDGSIRLIRC